ncbi:hypothetical protein C8J56DRAFT_1061896 [Mycena floridula]|nr:hypothetical protein C8J56DRAFT_1061896 [Mycena floridula]
MLLNNIFDALILAAVVMAGPANTVYRIHDYLLIQLMARGTISIRQPCPLSCAQRFVDTDSCFSVPPAAIGTVAVETSGYECSFFQGAGCTGDSVTVTPADGNVTVSNIVSGECVAA